MDSIFKVWSDSFIDGTSIPEGFAFCKPDPSSPNHVAMAGNRNPQISWSTPPQNTKSLILLCEDFDVPSDPTDVNREGIEIPATLPRVAFTHWVLVDISPEESTIDAGTFSRGISSRGKGGPASANGTRQGLNDYTGWFESDPDMSGKYYGYDGPCPPWNDSIVHRYHFTVYACDFALLPLEGTFTCTDVKQAMEGHVLASAEIVGTYTLNPRLRVK